MDSAGGTAAQNSTNLNSSDSTGIKVPEGVDMDAINEAIAATAKDASNTPQQSFDVNDISLDNTPTTDAALEQQQAKDPTMNLANSGAATSATATPEPAAPAATPEPAAPAATPEPAAPAAPAADAEKPAAPSASFVDGDIVDAPAEESKEPAPEQNYDAALNADPLASFDENAAAPAETEATQAAEGDAKAEDEKDAKKTGMKKEIKIHIDFDKIIHSNLAVAGIVIGIIVILVAVVLIATLNG